MPFKISTVAGSVAVAEEVLASIKQIFGDIITGKPFSFSDSIAAEDADLFICFVSRLTELAKTIPSKKILGIEMMPSPKCCVKLATLPSSDTRWVFCNSRRSAKVIVDYCSENGLSVDLFDYATFDDTSEQTLLEILGHAKYIVGVSPLVAPGRVLHQRYGQYLRPDCEIIAVDRILTPNSVVSIQQWLTASQQTVPRMYNATCCMRENLERLKEEVAERKLIQERLEYENTHDSLTGLYNRRFLESAIDRLPGNCTLPLAVISIDLDRLKHINDTYGHDEGDTAIKEAALIISQSIGQEHIVARIGGDEFVALLENTSEPEVHRIIAKLFEEAEKSSSQKCRVPIKLSVGYSIAHSYIPPRQLLKSADEAMYKDKTSQTRSELSTVPTGGASGAL